MSQFKHYAPVSDKQLGFYIDSSRCSGCKACQVACKDKNLSLIHISEPTRPY